MGASVVSARKVTEEGEWLAVCGDLNGDTVIASHSSQKNACVARGKRGGDGSRYNENLVGSDRAAWKVAVRGRVGRLKIVNGKRGGCNVHGA